MDILSDYTKQFLDITTLPYTLVQNKICHPEKSAAIAANEVPHFRLTVIRPGVQLQIASAAVDESSPPWLMGAED